MFVDDEPGGALPRAAERSVDVDMALKGFGKANTTADACTGRSLRDSLVGCVPERGARPRTRSYYIDRAPFPPGFPAGGGPTRMPRALQGTTNFNRSEREVIMIPALETSTFSVARDARESLTSNP